MRDPKSKLLFDVNDLEEVTGTSFCQFESETMDPVISSMRSLLMGSLNVLMEFRMLHPMVV